MKWLQASKQYVLGHTIQKEEKEEYFLCQNSTTYTPFEFSFLSSVQLYLTFMHERFFVSSEKVFSLKGVFDFTQKKEIHEFNNDNNRNRQSFFFHPTEIYFWNKNK